MKTKNKISLAILVLVIVAGIAASQLCKADVEIGKNLDSELVDHKSNPVNFSDFKGKVVVINNWASWCPPCIAEMPSINQLKKALNSDEIVFVMVSFDEDPLKAKNFLKKKGYDLEVYFPGSNYPYVTSSIPVTFVLDRGGKVVLQHEGMFDYGNEEFAKTLKSLMK